MLGHQRLGGLLRKARAGRRAVGGCGGGLRCGLARQLRGRRRQGTEQGEGTAGWGWVGQTFRLWIPALILNHPRADFTSPSFCYLALGPEGMLPGLGKARRGLDPTL